MLKRIRERMNEDEGFTLIELMVVVLIIAILIAIAIPTFLGARERAQDRAAQSSLRNAVTAAKTIFTDNEDYTEADASALEASEPSLTFRDTGDSTDQNEVSVHSATASEFAAAALSNSGTCFYIKDDTQGPGTTFGSLEDGSASCAGTDADDATTGATEDSW